MGDRKGPGILLGLVGSVVPLLLRLLAATWSFTVVNRKVLRDAILSGKPVVAATWHEMVVPGVVFFRDRRSIIMVSRSVDGEMIARVNLRMGYRNIRGSSSRGGAQALQEMIREVREGAQAAIMVDGPKGPRYEPKMGCVIAARESGAPIVPVACRVRGSLRARNWDRTIVPLPCARLAVSFGEPIHVPPDAGPDECERLRLRVRDSLLCAGNAAEKALGP